MKGAKVRKSVCEGERLKRTSGQETCYECIIIQVMCQFPLESSLEDRDDDDDVRGMTSYTSTRLNQIHI